MARSGAPRTDEGHGLARVGVPHSARDAGRGGWLAAVAGALTRPLLGEPLALPPAQLSVHPELAGARFRRGGLPPRVGGWALGARSVAAITLWRTIFVAPGVELDPALLLHELGHVHQFGASATFPARYVWESLRRGYSANRFEAEADAFAATQLAAARRRGDSSAPAPTRVS